MFYKLKGAFARARFARACKGVLRAPPVALDPHSEVAFLSQIQHRDLLMFLLAVKSFARRVRPQAIFVLNDGSLTDIDRATLHEQIPCVTVLELQQFRSAVCPTGGTWERLLAISDLVSDYYVVQLDSDTLTLNSVGDVLNCVEMRKAFTLGTWDNQQCEEMREQWDGVTKQHIRPESHVQLVAEANFHKLRDFSSLRYIRGCSGFAGFPRHSFEREFVENISTEMRAAIGPKWEEWGSEQVMSNIVVANIAGALVLPHPKYADCHKMRPSETVFVHFIGSCRFASGTYARLGARVVTELNEAAHDEARRRSSKAGGAGGGFAGPNTR